MFETASVSHAGRPGAILGSVGALGRGLLTRGGVWGAIFIYFFGSRGPPPWPGAPKQLRGPRQLRGMPNGMRRLCIYIKPVSSRLRTGRTGIRADGRGAAASRGPFGPANHGAACLSGSRAGPLRQRGPTLSLGPGPLSSIYRVKSFKLAICL